MHIPSQTVNDSLMEVSLSMSHYKTKMGCDLSFALKFNDSERLKWQSSFTFNGKSLKKAAEKLSSNNSLYFYMLYNIVTS